MTALRVWLRQSWDGQSGLPGRLVIGLLRPTEAVYRSAITLRNRCYDHGLFRQLESSIPIISVGNIAVGGTGKTPIASWLVGHLDTTGHRPALVTRGYGPDEVLLHEAHNPGVPLVIRKSKVEGIAEAVKEGAAVAILDDGFQHRAAKRDVDIVLLAAEQGSHGSLLPRGRFREPMSALSRADVVIVTRKVATRDEARAVGRQASVKAPHAVLGQIHLAEDVWTELGNGPMTDARVEPPAGDLLAVSSIAEPDTFHEMVRARARGAVTCMVFPDHHPYSEKDVRRIRERAAGRSVVVTEKDAVKLSRFKRDLPGTYVLRLRVAWDFGQDSVMELIEHALDRKR